MWQRKGIWQKVEPIILSIIKNNTVQSALGSRVIALFLARI